jgi:hypothetical protein
MKHSDYQTSQDLPALGLSLALFYVNMFAVLKGCILAIRLAMFRHLKAWLSNNMGSDSIAQ